MTKKLKRKMKRITFASLGLMLSTITVGVIGARSFVMPKDEISKTKQIEAENIEIISGNSTDVQVSKAGSNVASDGAIICDSLVQGARDNDLTDGNYTFRVTAGSTTKNYAVELINFYDNVTYSLSSGQTSRTVSLGDTGTTPRTLIVKYHKNLTIDKGVTVTATNVSNLTYKKGMYLCVMGELVNNGTISMTARGTYNVQGEDVYLWKNNDSSYEYVPASGASGLSALNPYATSGQDHRGRTGNAGTSRRTGGGGQGSVITNRSKWKCKLYLASIYRRYFLFRRKWYSRFC